MSQRVPEVQESERVRALLAMRFGPRQYTDEQADFIERIVQDREPLREPALPIEEDTR